MLFWNVMCRRHKEYAAIKIALNYQFFLIRFSISLGLRFGFRMKEHIFKLIPTGFPGNKKNDISFDCLF